MHGPPGESEIARPSGAGHAPFASAGEVLNHPAEDSILARVPAPFHLMKIAMVPLIFGGSPGTNVK